MSKSAAQHLYGPILFVKVPRKSGVVVVVVTHSDNIETKLRPFENLLVTAVRSVLTHGTWH